MDETKTIDYVVDEIFNKFEKIFRDKWLKIFSPTLHINFDAKRNHFKKIWMNGLRGCTYREIKHALAHYESLVFTNKHLLPPSIYEFYKVCKWKSK